MDFSLTTMFVLPSGNTLPTTGSTENLLAGQLGVFRNDYSVATAGNLGSTPYVYVAQGRKENIPDVGTKRSDRIATVNAPIRKVVDFYKITAEPDVPLQSTIASAFEFTCGEEYWFTIRAHSNYIETGFFNGLTQSVRVLAPCCDCGEDPCTTVDDAAINSMLDQAIAQFQITGAGTQGNIQTGVFSRVVSSYVDVYRTGSGATASLVFQAKPLPVEAISCADFSLNPWMYDRLWFQIFVTKAPATTQDYEVFERCDNVATITVTNRSLFPRGSYEELAWMEKYYYSYQSPAFKALVVNNAWNGAYETYLEPGVFYDTYYVRFLSYQNNYTWDNALPQDETVIIAVPTGQTAGLEAILVAAFGPVADLSPANVTTTTTTSTTSSTTTSTTTLVP